MEDEPTPALPVCVVVAAGEPNRDLMCLRLSCPGGIERAFAIEGGVASVVVHDGDRLERLTGVVPDRATVEREIGAAADGALLVGWDLALTSHRLRAHHHAPEQLLMRALVELDLRAAALLTGAIDDGVVPSLDGLARQLSLTAPGHGVREQALFQVRAVRRFAASGTWLGRVLALGFDERSIVRTCVHRLGEGKTAYGPWDLGDDRDYAREAYEEVIDGLHYAAAGLLRIQDQARNREVG